MTEQELYERIESLCYNIPNRLETPITSAREIVSEFKAYADAQVAEKDADISRLEAENERLREGIERVVASNSSHPWSAIDREDLIEDVHQMNAVLKSLLSPAPEKPEEKPATDSPQLADKYAILHRALGKIRRMRKTERYWDGETMTKIAIEALEKVK